MTNHYSLPISFDLEAYLKQKQDLINTNLKRIFDTVKRRSAGSLDAAMAYSIMAGGKRVRPILCLAAAETVADGDITATAMATACALEMIHTYSLIHDDLPAMDNDDIRRGKPTCHVKFNEATAILAGDALLTLAFDVLSDRVTASDKKKTAPSMENQLKIIHMIASAAGWRGMIEGQVQDMESEGKKLDIDALKALHLLKTGALIQAAVMAGVILGGGNHRQMEMMSAYAHNIGLAFQVTDDILNVEGDPVVMGKAAGTDFSRSKNTYPALLGMTDSKDYANELIEKALAALSGFNYRADPLRAIAHYIITRER
jgi:geranylgeranyl diphosphate synthase type II